MKATIVTNGIAAATAAVDCHCIGFASAFADAAAVDGDEIAAAVAAAAAADGFAAVAAAADAVFAAECVAAAVMRPNGGASRAGRLRPRRAVARTVRQTATSMLDACAWHACKNDSSVAI